MSIRIGSSCALSVPMALGKVIETRLFISGTQSKWREVADKSLKDNQYLIVTPCINRNDGSGHYPSDNEWTDFINITCAYLKNTGHNRQNTRISIVNEPMKYCSKEQYKNLINLAYPIVKVYGFLMGAGNEEFLTAQAKGNMYQYILSNCQFDILDVHIQGSCDSAEKVDFWCNTVNTWTTKPKDCTEAFYSNINSSRGWELLKAQLNGAENILHCENFCNVFNNLDTTQFPFDTSGWHKLCFMVNGSLRSSYWPQWEALMNSKVPIPNIPKIKGVKDGMIIKTIGHKTNDIKSGYGVELLHELLLYKKYIEEDDIKNMFVYDEKTRKSVEQFQTDLRITKDGRVGRQTWRNFISSVGEAETRNNFQFNFEVVMSPYNLKGDT